WCGPLWSRAVGRADSVLTRPRGARCPLPPGSPGRQLDSEGGADDRVDDLLITSGFGSGSRPARAADLRGRPSAVRDVSRRLGPSWGLPEYRPLPGESYERLA